MHVVVVEQPPPRDDRYGPPTDVDGWVWVCVCNYYREKETPAALHDNLASRTSGPSKYTNKVLVIRTLLY